MFSDATSATSDVTVTLYGTYVLRWREFNGTCGDSAEVTVDFNEQPAADAGAMQNQCGVLTTTLAAVPYGYQPGSEHGGNTTGWVYGADRDPNPVFSDAASATSDVTVTLYGAYVLRWREFNGTCGESAQ